MTTTNDGRVGVAFGDELSSSSERSEDFDLNKHQKVETVFDDRRHANYQQKSRTKGHREMFVSSTTNHAL